ncbi:MULTISPECIES: hypothetical protein [unclassified Curtobacterium]|uniref:hypothetical protein n=1 Tax=unclassified Curtobacterium TaxID=257496 RepID=UPI003A813A36
MDAFATVDDLETRLGRSFTDDRRSQIQALLEDASTYLRDAIGQQVYPQSTTTFTAWPENGRVVLPQQPVTAVSGAHRAGQAVSYCRTPEGVTVAGDSPVDITFTFGYAEAPDGLRRWTCVLVSQTLTTMELNLGLSAGGLSSVGIDDFRAAFADGGASTGMALTESNQQRLREQYGSTVHVGSMQ